MQQKALMIKRERMLIEQEEEEESQPADRQTGH